MRYSKAKDFMIAAALAFSTGDHASAAKHLQKAADSDDFDDTLVDMNDEQADALDTDGDTSTTPSGGEVARKRAVASFRRAARRAQIAGDDDMDDDEMEDDDIDDDSNGDAEDNDDDDDDTLDEEVSARLRRAARTRANLRVVSKMKPSPKRR